MGKRVLAALLAVAAIGVLARAPQAQEATPEPETSSTAFVPGTFLTAEDYEHMEAALACVNLTPGDLKYEKKHRPDDKLRLKVCDAALDDPMGLPGAAENCSTKFASGQPRWWGCETASSLLDQDARQWSKETLEADHKEGGDLLRASNDAYTRLKAYAGDPDSAEGKKLKKEHEEASEAYDFALCEAIFGEKPNTLIAGSEFLDSALPWFGKFIVARSTLAGTGDLRPRMPAPKESLTLGASTPSLVTDGALKVPGGESGEAADGLDACTLGTQVPIAQITVAGSRLSDILADLADNYMQGIRQGFDSIKGTAAHEIAGVTGSVVAAWQSKWGKVVIGGIGSNSYEGNDFIGVIDFGGDDVYKGRFACGVGLEGKAPLSFVLDLSGDDRYEGEDFTQGFGFLGVGILHDLGGGDDYYKSRFCAQGCGLCGYGELYDDGGDDIYRTDSGSQGAGCFGYGHLIDQAGNDTYRGARYVQGFAQVMGVGVLTDGAGNDLYYAGGKYLHQPLWNDRYQSLSQGFSIGNRNDRGVGTGGGVALLLDEGDGNDVYQSDIYGQGSSYWYSLGMLVDRGGNDTYTSGQYCQGVGIHLSAGIMVDISGNDTYTMGVGLGQGAAHDWAVGWQIDRAGNDFYQGNGQGMGLNFSVGILLDCAGDDSHCTNNEGSIGKGSNNDISVLLDLAGADSYGPKEVKDGQFTRRGDHQLIYDVPQGWFPAIDTSTWPTKQTPAPETAVVQHILIAWDGTGIDNQKAARTKEQAWALAQRVMKDARSKNADWKQLQADYNEDCSANPDGTTNTHNKYTASAEAKLVKPFKDMALSLGAGQINVCESKYGYHIIKRVE